MKSLLLFPIVYLGFAFTTLKPTLIKETAIKIAKESELTISGSTNINTFECNYKVERITDPITVSYEQKQKALVFHHAVLKLDNNCFDCGSKPINRDFKVLVKSKLHPNILLKLDKVLHNNGKEADVLTDIQIAGVTRAYKVPVSVNSLGGSTLNVSGVLNLNISDFHLKPPKKVFGLIEVDNTIQIGFRLVLKES